MLQTQEIQEKIQWITQSHQEFSDRIQEHPKVRSTRSLGIIFALDLNTETERYGGLREKLLTFFMDRGVFLRPLGNTIYLQVPYVISKEELTKVYEVLEASLEIV